MTDDPHIDDDDMRAEFLHHFRDIVDSLRGEIIEINRASREEVRSLIERELGKHVEQLERAGQCLLPRDRMDDVMREFAGNVVAALDDGDGQEGA